MDTGGHRELRAGSPVGVLRRRRGTPTETQGIVSCAAVDSSIGIRLAGSPGYTFGEKVTLVDYSDAIPWAVDASFVSQADGVAYFRKTVAWYRHDNNAGNRYRTGIRVTVTSPGGNYLERGIATAVSQCGLHISVPAEPENREILVLMPGDRDGGGVTLPCRLVTASYRDDGVELHAAFHELDTSRAKYVARLVDELRIVAEWGRDLIDTGRHVT